MYPNFNISYIQLLYKSHSKCFQRVSIVCKRFQVVIIVIAIVIVCKFLQVFLSVCECLKKFSSFVTLCKFLQVFSCI